MLTLSVTFLATDCLQAALLEKVRAPQLLKKFPAFYGPQRFVTTFTRACHFSVSCAKLIVHGIRSYFSQDFLGDAPIYAQVFHRSLAFSFPHQKPESISHLPIPATTPSLIAFNHEAPHYAVSYYFFHLGSKHPPHRLSSNILSLCSFLNKRACFTPIQNNKHNCSSVNFNLYILTRKREDIFMTSHANHAVTRTCSFVANSMCICLLAAVQWSDGSNDAHFDVNRNRSVIDWLVGLQRSPVRDSSDAILTFTRHQHCIIATANSLVRTYAVFAITLSTDLHSKNDVMK